MFIEALSWYAESLSAFWVSLAGGGLFKLLMIWCFIYWIFCRPRRRGWRWRWRHHHGCCGWHGGHGGHCGRHHGHDCDYGHDDGGHGGHREHCKCRCGGCTCGVSEAGEAAPEAAEAEDAEEAPAAG